MADENALMPGDIPDWVKEAEEQMKKEWPIDLEEKKEVTINPCHSSENLINFWRYSIGRKWYELKWRLFK